MIVRFWLYERKKLQSARLSGADNAKPFFERCPAEQRENRALVITGQNPAAIGAVGTTYGKLEQTIFEW
ncbi:MAG: hypothetical protein IAE95_06605 [Chitinophagaceae bacterium]|nr:hypothetical protein [Chitinophagaceae bacterium]